MSIQEEQPIQAAYQDYIAVFETLDVQAMLPFFGSPCMFVTPHLVIALEDPAKLAGLLSKVTDGLRAQEYMRSAVSAMRIRLLGGGIASLQANVVRYNREDAELERMGLTYIFRKVHDAWKMVVITVHDEWKN